MIRRTTFRAKAAALASAAFLSVQGLAGPALAENQMGYRLLTPGQAASLPRGGGSIGLDVGRAQQISDSGLTFELLRVKGVRANSPAARAGFNVGDQIIAADGRVFPSVAAFAAYVGSVPPGRQIAFDYMPAGSGPQDAQRLPVTVGASGRAAAARQAEEPQAEGLSTGTKLAIGVGAAALFGCYKAGCFSSAKARPGGAAYQSR